MFSSLYLFAVQLRLKRLLFVLHYMFYHCFMGFVTPRNRLDGGGVTNVALHV